ncbi:MAG: sigma-70 family RNA polymerase sigma factor [Verrucomicrobiales bacterium]|nr:sigma-70 family RNA polymerase sigma factor [Verrucomicrobiales bacterium]
MTPAQPTRPSLLVAIRDPGNERAWSEFVNLYTPLVFGHCRRRGLQEADAADVAQDVMRAVAQAIRRFEYDRVKGSFRSWLLTVTRSKLANFFSRESRQPQAASDTQLTEWTADPPSPEELGEWDVEYRQRLFDWAAESVRSEFQPSSWQAFWRTAVDHQPVAQVAADLALSPGAVYIARSRIIARLRDFLHEAGDEPELPGGMAVKDS